MQDLDGQVRLDEANWILETGSEKIYISRPPAVSISDVQRFQYSPPVYVMHGESRPIAEQNAGEVPGPNAGQLFTVDWQTDREIYPSRLVSIEYMGKYGPTKVIFDCVLDERREDGKYVYLSNGKWKSTFFDPTFTPEAGRQIFGRHTGYGILASHVMTILERSYGEDLIDIPPIVPLSNDLKIGYVKRYHLVAVPRRSIPGAEHILPGKREAIRRVMYPE